MIKAEKFIGELENKRDLQVNLNREQLVREAVANSEGQLTKDGVLTVSTFPYTGRSPKDKFSVEGAEGIDYGKVNQPLSREKFEQIKIKAIEHLANTPNLYEQNLRIGADPEYSLPVKVFTPNAWSALFVENLFLPPAENFQTSKANYTILHAPNLKLKGEEDGVRSGSEVGVITDHENGVIVIAGTKYAGEMKKAMFGVAQEELPKRGVATMHCSANIDNDGRTAIFFGLSGTGKTTLSTDGERMLIGDDEHAWSDKGIFNLEGGSYAKMINLSAQSEPQIYEAVHKKGAVMENVNLDEEGNPIFSKGEENMRGAFPLDFIPNTYKETIAPHPETIIMLTADASGVLPPVALLNNDSAIYHFLSGYTSKVAGTERGITEPEATFSACFGDPFLTLPPERYAELLAEKLNKHNPKVWLINTGWPGGVEKGKRMSIEKTRTIVNAVLSKDEQPNTFTLDKLGFLVPLGIKDISSEEFKAENYWEDKREYKKRAVELADAFTRNFEQFVGKVDKSISGSGPRFRYDST